MQDSIQIIEKPDWISWDDIHEIVWQAHARNREKGIVMRYPTLPGEEVRKRVEGNGKMLVALKEGKPVGTSAVIFKEKSMWCGEGQYAYCCFDAVLPDMQGMGVYKALSLKREAEATAAGVGRLLLDTNEKNQREINVVLKNGFKKVSMSSLRDHNNIVFVKWLNGCPYSKTRCWLEFNKRQMLVKSKRFLVSLCRRNK